MRRLCVLCAGIALAFTATACKPAEQRSQPVECETTCKCKCPGQAPEPAPKAPLKREPEAAPEPTPESAPEVQPEETAPQTEPGEAKPSETGSQACADDPVNQSPSHELEGVAVQGLQSGQATYSVPRNEALALRFTADFDGHKDVGVSSPSEDRSGKHYLVTVSKCPAEFDVGEIREDMTEPGRCWHTGGIFDMDDKIELAILGEDSYGRCGLEEGEEYYVNVRNSRASNGAPTQDSCEKDSCKVTLDY